MDTDGHGWTRMGKGIIAETLRRGRNAKRGVEAEDSRWKMEDGGWWLVAGGWWLVAGGWWMVDGGWKPIWGATANEDEA